MELPTTGFVGRICGITEADWLVTVPYAIERDEGGSTSDDAAAAAQAAAAVEIGGAARALLPTWLAAAGLGLGERADGGERLVEGNVAVSAATGFSGKVGAGVASAADTRSSCVVTTPLEVSTLLADADFSPIESLAGTGEVL